MTKLSIFCVLRKQKDIKACVLTPFGCKFCTFKIFFELEI